MKRAFEFGFGLLLGAAVMGLVLAFTGCATLAALGGISATTDQVASFASKADELDEQIAQSIREARAAQVQAAEAKERALKSPTDTEARLEMIAGLVALWGGRELTRRKALKNAGKT